MSTARLFRSPEGKFIISILWGLGIATLFQKVCEGNCIVVKAADPEQVRNKTFQITDEGGAKRCVKFEPRFVNCPSNN